MQRKILRNGAVAAVVIIGLASFVVLRVRSLDSMTCVSATPNLVPATPLSQTTPLLPTAVQQWGNAAFTTHLPVTLSNGHSLFYLSTLSDGSMLVSETQICGNSWLSISDHGTIRHTHTFPNIPDFKTDGRYVAWITNNTSSGISNDPFGDATGSVQRQIVGYEDLQTGKSTTLYDLDARDFDSGFKVSNGYFFWVRNTTKKNNMPTLGSIHMTNIATGSTQDLHVTGNVSSVSWPYVLYLASPNSKSSFMRSYHVYNIQTNQDVKTRVDFDRYRYLSNGHQAFIFVDSAKNELMQIDPVGQPDAAPRLIFTLPGDSPINQIWMTDRLFMWSKGEQLYAWDRVLQKDLVLPVTLNFNAEPNWPQIEGNIVILLTNSATQRLEYTIIDTDKLPIIAP